MSTNPKARAWVQVEADALRRNFREIRDAVGPDVRTLPMVKANAYGLGSAEVVACLDPEQPWGYGVAAVAEGVRLRELGVERPLVVCSPVPTAEMGVAVRHDLQLSISSETALEALADAAASEGRVAEWHLDVDTGMGRSGFDWRTAHEWLGRVTAPRKWLGWVGAYTHLHSADEGPETVHDQWNRLSAVLERAEALEHRPDGLMVHVLNSAGVFRAPEYAQAVVRPGIFLYGGGIGGGQPDPAPVASLHARVVHLREAPAGTTVGYGSTYAASVPERWATLSVGYGDGLPRALSNRGSAIVDGTKVPIIGRISMDVTVVDVTGVSEVHEGSVATLIGSQGDERITLDEVADRAGTISYEILTGLTSRLPRVWC
jgi:alanine racemase